MSFTFTLADSRPASLNASMMDKIDLVTIDNFYEKLSKWDQAHKQLFAIVDMGSNGIRFSISDLSPVRSRLLPCLYSERAPISLYDALHDHGVKPDREHLFFPADIISKVAKTLAHFKSMCDKYEVPSHQIDVFATAAMRSAHNKNEMLAEIKKQSGLDVKILEPSTESLFGAMGARSGFESVDGLFMDLGGGSCQMTYVDSQQKGYEKNAANAGRSIPYGAARLIDELSRAQTPADTSRIITGLNSAMREIYAALKAQSTHIKEKLEHPDGINVYMCGGGFRGYGSMLMHKHELQPYPIPAIGGFTVSGRHFSRSEKMLEANMADEKIFGLSKRRRKQFPAIIQVIEAVIAVLPNIRSVTFCTGSNREGALFMKLPSHVQESNPLDLYPCGLSNPRDDFDYSSTQDSDALDSIVCILFNALPEPARPIFKDEFLRYIAKNIWVEMGTSDEANSSRALHITTSGILDGLPGVTHELRAVIAITLCARWGTVLGPANQIFHDKLQNLLGKDLAFMCQYLGTVARFLALFSAVLPKDGNAFCRELICVESSYKNNLGKKQKKEGISVWFDLSTQASKNVELKNYQDLFERVGKGLGKKVKASFTVDSFRLS